MTKQTQTQAYAGQKVRTSRILKLSHSRHTGKLTPHRSTSYPTLAMLLLVVGVLLGGMTRVTNADSVYGSGSGQYVVMASVPGPAPTTAAVITAPLNGSHVTSTPITVTGTCPNDSYITLNRNGLFSGVALCSAAGSWSIETALFSGRNDLVAKVFNLTDIAGPMLGAVTVYYDPPTIPVNSPGDTGTGAPRQTSQTGQTAQPNQPPKNSSGTKSAGTQSQPATIDAAANAQTLLLKSNFLYKGYYANQTVSWHFAVDGGTAPYAISIDWGDGYRTLVSRPVAGQFNLDHRYTKQGAYRGSYVIKATATDAANNETVLQLLAIINEKPGTAALSTTDGAAGSGGSFLQTIRGYLLPSYGIAVLMVASFWLGEIRELRNLRLHRGSRNHHA